MDAGDVQRAIWRIAHEILEHNRGSEGLVVVGLQTGGVWLASALADVIGPVSGREVPVGALDVAYYRDDIGLRPVLPVAATEIPVPLDGAVVVLCDDVLFTGRTVRAALNALCDLGRPAAVQLAVMVDRGHREFPIRPDYVGKNLPTRRLEMVDVGPTGVVLGDIVDGPGRTESGVSDGTGGAESGGSGSKRSGGNGSTGSGGSGSAGRSAP
jgi:pyrimidine operon attenuation protein/uracil phosphoribosyltransferase